MSRGLLWALEAWLTQTLMRSPTFNHGVHKLHKRYQRLRHGIPPEEMGGTNRDEITPGGKGFFAHWTDELKDQVRLKENTRRPPPPRPPPDK